MRRKAVILVLLATLLVAATAGNSPVYGRAVAAVRNFQRNFLELEKADSMSPVERFVFSLVLANAKAPRSAADAGFAVAGRT